MGKNLWLQYQSQKVFDPESHTLRHTHLAAKNFNKDDPRTTKKLQDQQRKVCLGHVSKEGVAEEDCTDLTLLFRAAHDLPM